MKKTKVQKPGRKRQTLKAAPWVDKELRDNVDLRSEYSREWRYARKRGDQEEIKKCKEKYYTQKGVTATMVGNKKSGWEEMKILETEGNPEAFWRMIKVLGLGLWLRLGLGCDNFNLFQMLSMGLSL